jgi:hypothetical protein
VVFGYLTRRLTKMKSPGALLEEMQMPGDGSLEPGLASHEHSLRRIYTLEQSRVWQPLFTQPVHAERCTLRVGIALEQQFAASFHAWEKMHQKVIWLESL